MELSKIKEILKKELPLTNIKFEEPMNLHTSFKIGGIADVFITANNIEEVKKILDISKENNIPLKVIGNGTNLLVKDKGYRGIILKINLQNIEINKNDDKNFNEKNEIITKNTNEEECCDVKIVDEQEYNKIIENKEIVPHLSYFFDVYRKNIQKGIITSTII